MSLESPHKNNGADRDFDTRQEEQNGGFAEQMEANRRESIKAAITKDIGEDMLRLHEGEPFHNEKHPKNVGADAKEVVDVFKRYGVAVTSGSYLAAETASAGHDVIINYSIETNPKAFNFGQRVRHRGFDEKMPENVRLRPEVAELDGRKIGNEEASWLYIQEVVRRYDPNVEIYTPAVMEEIREGVAATYPDAGPFVVPENYRSLFDPKTGETFDLTPYLGKDKDGNPTLFLFNQPLLGPDSKVSTIGIAWGDLLYGGKHGGDRFREHGNEEFREINEVLGAVVKGKMSEALQNVKNELPESLIKEIESGIQGLTSARKAEFAKSMLGWVFSQVGFLLGQKIRFEAALGGLREIIESSDPENLRRELRELYKNFDQNIIEAAKRVDMVRQEYGDLMSPETFAADPNADGRFKKLLKEMGYEIL